MYFVKPALLLNDIKKESYYNLQQAVLLHENATYMTEQQMLLWSRMNFIFHLLDLKDLTTVLLISLLCPKMQRILLQGG